MGQSDGGIGVLSSRHMGQAYIPVGEVEVLMNKGTLVQKVL